MDSIYCPNNFRKITKSEACRIQGFPANYQLPPTRPRWMKLIGNSVAVPVIKMLAEAIVKTGVFAGCETKTNTRIKQLDLFEVAKQYPENIVVNKPVKVASCKMEYPRAAVSTSASDINIQGVDISKNVLISLVKADNMEQYLDGSAKIYYTGKKFPSTVHLNKLYYFMPYLKGKGIRDLYYIKIARVGTKAEVHPECGDNDFRLVFEIEFVKQLLPDYTKVKLPIWETFNDTTMANLSKMPMVK